MKKINKNKRVLTIMYMIAILYTIFTVIVGYFPFSQIGEKLITNRLMYCAIYLCVAIPIVTIYCIVYAKINKKFS